MDLLIWVVVLLIVLLLVLVEYVSFKPNGLSSSELERRAGSGDKTAADELAKRQLLPLYIGLQRLKVTFLVVALVGALGAVYPLWLALAASLGLLLVVGLAVAGGWFNWLATRLQSIYEPYVWQMVRSGAPVFKLFAPKFAGEGELGFASKEELGQIINKNSAVLTTEEKLRLAAALHFGGKTVADAMVPASKVVTVGQSETVGPLLLDKLHKTGHNVIVVVGRGLDSVKGLLYMSDLVPLDPAIKTVKDAMRSKVFYVAANASLGDVLAASIKTGRQLFLVAQKGKVVGLVTLADALEHVLGGRLSKESAVAAKPEDL